MEVLRTYALFIGTTRINAVAASDAPLKKRPIRVSGACVGYARHGHLFVGAKSPVRDRYL